MPVAAPALPSDTGPSSETDDEQTIAKIRLGMAALDRARQIRAKAVATPQTHGTDAAAATNIEDGGCKCVSFPAAASSEELAELQGELHLAQNAKPMHDAALSPARATSEEATMHFGVSHRMKK